MKRRLILITTFVLGAAVLWVLLPENDNSGESDTEASHNESVLVWAAYAPIDKGETITLAHVRPARIPYEQAQELGATRFPITEETGYVATVDFQSGDIVSQRNLCTFNGDIPEAQECQKLISDQDKTSYPLIIKSSSDLRELVKPGDYIDVMLIAKPDTSLAYREELTSYQGLSAIPLLRQQVVVQVPSLKDEEEYSGKAVEQTVVVALTPENAAKVMIAKRVGVLDIHKSTRVPLPETDISKIVPDFSIIKELRGNIRVEQIPN